MFCGVNMDCYFHGCCQGEALKFVWHKQGELGMGWGHCPLLSLGTAAIRNCSAPPAPKGSSCCSSLFCDGVAHLGKENTNPVN